MLWGISWININMMMHDFPQWEYDTKDDTNENGGDEEINDFTQLIGRI